MSKITQNESLETALMFAGAAKDIASLKSLARRESRRADEIESLLVSVLKKTGKVVIANPVDAQNDGFSLSLLEGGKMIVEAVSASWRESLLNGGSDGNH